MIVTQKWFQQLESSFRDNEDPSAVLVTGGFDPLHYGHIRYIRAARACADKLALGGYGVVCVVVGVAPDSYILHKHPLLQTLEQRMEMLSSIRGVDFVAPQDEETAASIIRAVRPAVFLKGDDWLKRGLPQAEMDAIEEVGATVKFISVNPVSSSDLLHNLFQTWQDQKEAI